MKSIRETNWKYRYMTPPISRPYFYPRVEIIRYGITPTGKPSKYWASVCKYGTKEQNLSESELLNIADEINLPKLPKGYTWSEPYLI